MLYNIRLFHLVVVVSLYIMYHNLLYYAYFYYFYNSIDIHAYGSVSYCFVKF